MDKSEYFITGCILNNDKPKIILSSNKGNLYKINISDKLKLIDDADSLKSFAHISGTILSILQLDKDIIIIGLTSGEIIEYNLSENKTNQIGYSSRNGLWRILIINKSKFIITGKYGYIALYSKLNNEWTPKRLIGSKHSNFCLDWISKHEIITVDYWGNILIWKVDNEEITRLDIDLNILGNMQYATLIDRGSFALIHRYGSIYIFERSDDGLILNQAAEFSIASGDGTSIHLSNNFLLCGTEREILKINLDDNSIEKIEHPCLTLLKKNDGTFYVLDRKNVLNFDQLESTPFVNTQKHKYAKVGIIGPTGSGKSTLCHRLKEGSYDPKTSTLGRKVWKLTKIGKEILSQDSEILLYDVAGQESQLFTFFPRFWDCKIIFACYRHTSLSDFNVVLEALKKLKKFTPEDCKFILLETIKDSGNSALEGINIPQILEEIKFSSTPLRIPVSSKTTEGIDKILNVLKEYIDWNSIKPTIESDLLIEIKKYIEEQRITKGIRWLTIENLTNIMKEKKFNVTQRHLKYILRNLDEQGEIDYISSISLVIINDDIYNNFWSKVPTFVKNSGGYIFKKHLNEKLRTSEDLKKNIIRLKEVSKLEYFDKILDAVIQKFVNYRNIILFAEECDEELVIMPESLKETRDIPLSYKNIINYAPKKFCSIDLLNFPWYDFLERLKSLERNYKVKIVDLSKYFGIFSINNDKAWFVIDNQIESIGMVKQQMNIKLFFSGDDPNIILIIKKTIQNFLTYLFEPYILNSTTVNQKENYKNLKIKSQENSKMKIELVSKKKVISSTEKSLHNIKKKNLLLIGTSPEDDADIIPRIRYDKEFRKIQEVLQDENNLYLNKPVIILASRVRDLRKALLSNNPQIVQISAHGHSQGLILEDDDGYPVDINADAINNLFRQFTQEIKCIFFNCCESENIARELSNHIDYTIGMAGFISDEAAIIFSETFYEALSLGKDIVTAYNLGKNAIELENSPEKEIPKLFRKS